MKLLESTEKRITLGKNVENASHLEITEVTFVHCNIASNYHQLDSQVMRSIKL